jgi:hypothetical protein
LAGAMTICVILGLKTTTSLIQGSDLQGKSQPPFQAEWRRL